MAADASLPVISLHEVLAQIMVVESAINEQLTYNYPREGFSRQGMKRGGLLLPVSV